MSTITPPGQGAHVPGEQTDGITSLGSGQDRAADLPAGPARLVGASGPCPGRVPSPRPWHRSARWSRRMGAGWLGENASVTLIALLSTPTLWPWVSV